MKKSFIVCFLVLVLVTTSVFANENGFTLEAGLGANFFSAPSAFQVQAPVFLGLGYYKDISGFPFYSELSLMYDFTAMNNDSFDLPWASLGLGVAHSHKLSDKFDFFSSALWYGTAGYSQDKRSKLAFLQLGIESENCLLYKINEKLSFSVGVDVCFSFFEIYKTSGLPITVEKNWYELDISLLAYCVYSL